MKKQDNDWRSHACNAYNGKGLIHKPIKNSYK